MGAGRPLLVGIVAGEESGDLLAADLIRHLAQSSGREVRLVGVGGAHLQALGLRSLFDPQEISLMGFGAVVAGLPRIVRRIGQTAQAVAQAAPDCLLTVDVPDFALRVAKKVRALRPNTPAIHYVCPSVWAWRPGRAVAMRAFLDHVLCILPFEPAELDALGGPPGTYVGHRLTHEPELLAAAEAQRVRRRDGGARKTLLLLPGSRGGEIGRLLPDFRQTLHDLKRRGADLNVRLPTVPHLVGRVRAEVGGWNLDVQVTSDAPAKWQAFGEADAALIASGTVGLELALVGVPHVSCYRLDAITRPFRWMIRTWSASLPNLIADRPVIPEFFDEVIRPGSLARQIEQLVGDTPLRQWQLGGFDSVRQKMAAGRPAGAAGAEVVLRLIERPQRLAIGT
ncbi:MAG TPA: lipid-A-disaccharide synthase [Mesorhizobium sp.]|jgi:lipid-A-disaccharide synthase|nr:lipid-A-disaccharide synthase [Mesorhizobium sp.]